MLFLVLPFLVIGGGCRRDRGRGRARPRRQPASAGTGSTGSRARTACRTCRGSPAPALPGMIFGVGDSRQSTRPRARREAAVRRVRQLLVHDGLGQGPHHPPVGLRRGQARRSAAEHRARRHEQQLAVRIEPAGRRSTKKQRLSLEGDFDRHFSLYCPVGYERDALYLFTPDIMARFIDHAAALDVEIVDDWLFLYGQRQFSTLDPATWAWLFSVVGALLDKFAQWARWRDERLAMDAAAPGAVSGAVSSAMSPAEGAASMPFAAPGGAAAPAARRRAAGPAPDAPLRLGRVRGPRRVRADLADPGHLGRRRVLLVPVLIVGSPRFDSVASRPRSTSGER